MFSELLAISRRRYHDFAFVRIGLMVANLAGTNLPWKRFGATTSLILLHNVAALVHINVAILVVVGSNHHSVGMESDI